MRVLVTGGSGVIGAGLLAELIQRGHQVRLLARRADEAAREWPDEVEPFAGDVTDPEALAGAADGCDVVVHITGIVAESPPANTFERVNVGGTRNMLDEAVRAGSPRFIYVSSLGAERGTSAYHISKRRAETLVEEYPGNWAIVRPGNVYGPGDEVISQLLRMQRMLPVVPVVGFGEHEFQPVFYKDLGAALAEAVERGDLTGIFDVAGDEITTPAEIIAKFSDLTGRRPVPVPIPEMLAGMAARLAGSMGVPFPLDESKFLMLIEHNVVKPPEANALTRVFGVTATPLDDGLAHLVDAQPEQLPTEGFGGMERKAYWADIRDSDHDAKSLMRLVRERCTDLMAIEFAAEPGAPQEIVEGATLTAALPMRGNIQIRVEELTPVRFTLATLKGHPLAGIVRFETEDRGKNTVRFQITVCARAATMFDWLAMNTVGRVMQEQNWRGVVQGVVDISGGASDGVQVSSEACDQQTAAELEEEISDLIAGRKRQEQSR